MTRRRTSKNAIEYLLVCMELRLSGEPGSVGGSDLTSTQIVSGLSFCDRIRRSEGGGRTLSISRILKLSWSYSACSFSPLENCCNVN